VHLNLAMTADHPKPTNAVSFVDKSAYDSDDEGDASSLATTSTSASGVQLCFDDGKIPPGDGKNDDERVLNVSRIGGSAVRDCACFVQFRAPS